MIVKNFQLSEFFVTNSGLKNVTNDPTILHNIDKMALLLQAVRNNFNKPVVITSCYRCPSVNVHAGGAVNSYHLKARGCDFYVKGVSNELVKSFIQNHYNVLELILYKDGHLHVGF